MENKDYAKYGEIPNDIEERKRIFQEKHCTKCDYFNPQTAINGNCKDNYIDILGNCFNFISTEHNEPSLEDIIKGFVLINKNSGEEYKLKKRTAIGRSRKNDLILSGVGVETTSREHVVIVYDGENFYIKNLGNETFLNEALVKSFEKKLSDGDEIRISRFKFTFKRN